MHDLAAQLAQALTNLGISNNIVIFVISMIPILELRGGLLVAAILKVSMQQAIPICILGNILPIPFILLFIKQIFTWFKKVPGIGKIVLKLEERAMKKSKGMKQGEFWGLVLFVGVPLPGTGAWTGAMIASLLEMDFKKASLAIFLGVVLATIIMTIVSYGAVGALVR